MFKRRRCQLQHYVLSTVSLVSKLHTVDYPTLSKQTEILIFIKGLSLGVLFSSFVLQTL